MDKNRFSALFMVLVVILSIAGFTYAHWGKSVQIIGTVEMAHVRMTVISYKALTSQDIEKYSIVKSELSGDGHLLTLKCTNLRPCWFIWIGLKTQNRGSLPANVKPPEYSFEGPDGFEDYFETEEYFYGPYPEAEDHDNPIHGVWRNAKVGRELLEDGTVAFTNTVNSPSFPVDPDEKVVAWIWIHCEEDATGELEGETVTLYIKIVDDIAI